MTDAKRHSIEIHEGVFIYRSGKKGTFQCYFRIFGQKKNFRFSTKTRDEVKAKEVALKYFRNALNRTENEGSIEKISFKKLVKIYLKGLNRDPQNYKRSTIEGKYLPYFGDIDDISQMKKSDIIKYIEYCKINRNISPSTLKRELSELSQLLKFAQASDWINHNIKVPHISDKHTKKRKPHFTYNEYKKLYQTSRQRVLSAKKSGNTKIYWTRYLLHNYILFMVNTGLRVGEAKQIKWRDINFKKGYIQLKGYGKTNSYRKVFIEGYGTKALERLYRIRKEYLASENKTLSDNEFVICYPDGTKIKSQRKAFESLLKACNFDYSDEDDRHCFLSLRHTYATNKLISEDFTTRGLAKQMGTSERMINEHYGHDSVDDYRHKLQVFSPDGKRKVRA